MPNALPYVIGAVEIVFALAGIVLLWRQVLRPAARSRRGPSRLAPWETSPVDFFTFLLMVMGASFLAAAAAGLAGRSFGVRGDALTVLSGACAQLGMLAGVVAYRLGVEKSPAAPAPAQSGIFTSGFVTFLISLPILIATANVWEFLLNQLGLPTGRQDLIGMFANADSRWLLGVMIALAVVVAPLTEELVFRAGIFRFLRTRIPRWIALVLPAVFFALLHVNWDTLQGLASLAPLTVLAVVFSLAYERSGHIGTPMVAHACFNLNTIGVIFSGLDT